MLAGIPFYLLIGFSVRPPLRELVSEKFNRGAASQQFLVETIVGVNTVKSAAVEPIMRAHWEEKLAAYVKTSFSAAMLGSGGQLAIQYISKLTTAALLLFGARAVIDGQLTVGALVAFNMIAAQAIQPILRLSQIWQDFQQVQISIERLGDILNAAPESSPVTRLLPPTPRGAIEFAHVSFRYRPGGPEALKDVSLAIRAGETIGIVGPSGSGKSTLTKLIQRLYPPGEGQVLLDGADLAHVDPAWLRSHLGVVLQDNLLFNRTIHENIAFANPALARAQVIEIARLAGADEFIDKLTQGYDTMIEERGANLSGGQRQRIAIARALATNPRILILDEATSSLDYDSERIVQRNMRRIVKGRTVIIIAHRLAAVRACDRIVGMAGGRIVEVGSHDELIRSGGALRLSLGSANSTGGDRRVTAIRAVASTEPAPRSAKPAPSGPRTRFAPPGLNLSDREFLAPALEILETPPSPVHIAFLWIICAFVVAALAWAYFGRVDIVAAAQGKFQPTGRVKVVEPLETGRVEDIRVANGAMVKAGDVLVELDPSAAEADVQGARAELSSAGGNPAPQDRADRGALGYFRSAAEHRLAERRGVGVARARGPGSRRRSWAIGRDPSLVRRRAGAKDRRARQAHGDHRDPEEPRRDPRRAGQYAHEAGRREGRRQGGGHRRDRNAAISDYPGGEAGGRSASLSAGLEVIARDADKAVQAFVSDDAEKLDDAERRVEEVEQRLAKAQAELDRLTLKAPIAGRVQSSIITNVGQVVSSGQEIMRIVPEDSGLEIEAYVRNRDIGFVSIGQEAAVKVESFPYTRYGAIHAHVVRIARDAIPEPDAEAIEGDPARSSNASGFAGGERTQNLVFPVVLKPDAATISVDGADQPLTSGMAVTVELKTGRRRMLEYLFSPLVEVASKAMRER